MNKPYYFTFDHKKFFETYSSSLLTYGTGVLLLSNLMILMVYFMDLCRESMIDKPRGPYATLIVACESLIGRHLSIFDFVYLAIYQASALMMKKFKIQYIFFLLYLQLCKIFLARNTSDALASANVGLQWILSLQIFLVVLDFKFRSSDSTETTQDECTFSNEIVIIEVE